MQKLDLIAGRNSSSIMVTHERLLALMPGDAEHGDKGKFLKYLKVSSDNDAFRLPSVSVESISPDHVDFNAAYAMLYHEFGAKGEVESQEVLRERSKWDPVQVLTERPPLEYRLVILKHPPTQATSDAVGKGVARHFNSVDGQEIIGVRDHNIIFRNGIVVVHLSHSLLAEHARHRGLDTVLRAIPVLHGMEFASKVGHPKALITLYAEQEPVPTDDELRDADLHRVKTGDAARLNDLNMRFRRLAAYQGGSFKKVGAKMACKQPDFSSSEAITLKGGPAMVDFNGLLRFIGDEQIQFVYGATLKSVVSAVYDIYEASGLDPRAIAQARESISCYPDDDARVPLIPPLDLIP